MAFMVKDGFSLYYEDTGGNAPTLLFLHGAGGNHLSWWQQVPVFGDEYRCITVDQRGFGRSSDVSVQGPATLATDWPHGDTAWPESVQQITGRKRLTDTARRKLLGENALRLCPRLKGIIGNGGRAARAGVAPSVGG